MTALAAPDARRLMMLAGAGSLALLAAALTFEALGYAPCQMCLWQRWPHWAAVALGLTAFAVSPQAAPGLAAPVLRGIGALGLIAALATAGLGLFHTGVERGWWGGPASCGGGTDLTGLSGDALLTLDGPALVRCDEVAWSLMGLSMASWNALASLGLAALWALALSASRTRP